DSRFEVSADERAAIVERRLQFEKNPTGFIAGFELETADVKSAVEASRVRLPRVHVSTGHLRQIAQIALQLGVEGNRVDVFALKAARANAALAGRTKVTDDDIITAIQLVIAPRATIPPLE